MTPLEGELTIESEAEADSEPPAVPHVEPSPAPDDGPSAIPDVEPSLALDDKSPAIPDDAPTPSLEKHSDGWEKLDDGYGDDFMAWQ